MKSKVLFTRTISPEMVLTMYEKLGKELSGHIAIKLHSGEEGNQNYLTPEFWAPIIRHLDGTVVECNTAYEGSRNTTEKHLKTIEKHGWSRYFNVDLLDAEGPDLVLDIPDGKVIQKNYVGKDIANYNGMLVLSHFKGHPMGGYGGALKQLSIGCASSYGKAYIHGAGVPEDPIAIDQACLDLVYASEDPGKEHLIERIESRNGVHTIEAAEALGYGSRDYELIEIK